MLADSAADTDGQQRRTRSGAILVLAATALAGFGAVLAKVAYAHGFDPMPLLAVRFIIAAILLAPIAWQRWGETSSLTRPLLVKLLAVTVANLVAAWFFFNGLNFAPASVVAPIFFTYPAIVLLATRALGEGITAKHIAALVVGWSGVWLLSGGQGQVNLRAIGYSLAAAAAFAAYIVIVKSILERLSILYSVAVQFALLAVGATLLWLLTGEQAGTSWQGWLAAGTFAVLATAIARLAYYAGLKRIGSRLAALFGLAEPLAVVFFAGLLLGERLDFSGWAGAALILLSSAWSVSALNSLKSEMI